MPDIEKFDVNSQVPLYIQIANSFRKKIDTAKLLPDEKLPSINEFSKKHGVARDTIERAYKILKKDGFISSVSSRGYFVNVKKKGKLKILLVFNKLSSFKKIIYYSFIEALGNKAHTDLAIHHYNIDILKEIISKNKGKYDYFVIMPHFQSSVLKAQYNKVIKIIPQTELMFLDKGLPEFKNAMSVHQDFKNDIYQALVTMKGKFKKYKKIFLLFPDLSNHPVEIIDGVKQFCKESGKAFSVLSKSQLNKVAKGDVFIVIEDDDLAALIKKIRTHQLAIGTEVGIISFNETALKDLLDITVFTTDFEQMGKTAAALILNRQHLQVKNPFRIIERGSV